MPSKGAQWNNGVDFKKTLKIKKKTFYVSVSAKSNKEQLVQWSLPPARNH